MMDFHKGRWRLALGRLVNLRYINRWIIFSADLFVSLSVSLLGVQECTVAKQYQK